MGKRCGRIVAVREKCCLKKQVSNENPNFAKNNEDGISKRNTPDIDGKEAQRNGRVDRIISECGSRIEEAIRSAQEAKGAISGREKQEIGLRITEAYAKENGLWIPMSDVFSLGNPMIGGNENDVYLDVDKGIIYKVNNLINSEGNILNLFEAVKSHNEIFSETQYDIVGFTGFDGRSIMPVLSQRYIQFADHATPAEIAEYMASIGFEKITDSKFTNGEYIVSDLHPRNVLKSESGNIYVIDDIIRKNTPAPKSEQTKSTTTSATIKASINTAKQMLKDGKTMEEVLDILDKQKQIVEGLGVKPKEQIDAEFDAVKAEVLKISYNFAKNNEDGKSSKTGLDNGRTVENSPFYSLVGGSETGSRIYKTIEASNNAGSPSTVLTTEEREELESRGINPDFDKKIFRAEFKKAVNTILHGTPQEKAKLTRRFFKIADTPSLFKEKGLKGESITIGYGVINRHVGKDADHNLTEKEWDSLVENITKPIAITKHGDGFRIWTTTELNGKNLVVGVDVKQNGKDLFVNSIATVFAKDIEHLNNEEAVYIDETSPYRGSVLAGRNSQRYFHEEGLSDHKVNSIIDENQINKVQLSLSDIENIIENNSQWKYWVSADVINHNNQTNTSTVKYELKEKGEKGKVLVSIEQQETERTGKKERLLPKSCMKSC